MLLVVHKTDLNSGLKYLIKLNLHLTLRRWWQDEKFPEPVKLNGTALAWHVETISEWINHNIKK